MEKSNGSGEPARTTARICRQRIHHEEVMPRNPHAQMVHSNAGKMMLAGSGAVSGTDDAAGAVNGSPTSSITTENFDWIT